RPGGQPALRGEQPAGQRAGAVRGALLRAGRDGEPDQGAAALVVRRPDQLSEVPVQPVPPAALSGGVCAGGGSQAAAGGRDATGAGGGGDDPAAPVQGGGAGGAQRPAGAAAALQRLPTARPVRPGAGAAGRRGWGGGGGSPGGLRRGSPRGEDPPPQRWGKGGGLPQGAITPLGYR